MENIWQVDAFAVSVWFCVGFTVSCWLLSVITKEYSWVDRIWSITPVVYVAIFAYYAEFTDARLNLMLALSLAWGARLTYNFWRKGGYKPGGEDYRWEEVKSKIGEGWFQVMNATFIAPYQNFLLWLIAMPAFIAFANPDRGLNAIDYGAAIAFLFFLIGETVADEQQWRFQTDKYARLARGEAVSEQFLTNGLFRYSRHPNFFCEQAMWWTFYFFGVAATGVWLNWTIAGAFLLSLLFQGSTSLTEKISVRKYPEYAEYQKRTSRLLPLPSK
ncbi:MAG: DUF1295 domain-containing protein [Polyangiales bacterium]